MADTESLRGRTPLDAAVPLRCIQKGYRHGVQQQREMRSPPAARKDKTGPSKRSSMDARL